MYFEAHADGKWTVTSFMHVWHIVQGVPVNFAPGSWQLEDEEWADHPALL